MAWAAADATADARRAHPRPPGAARQHLPGALHDGRDNDLQHRTPITIFDGLRPQPARERHPKKPATSLHIKTSIPITQPTERLRRADNFADFLHRLLQEVRWASGGPFLYLRQDGPSRLPRRYLAPVF